MPEPPTTVSVNFAKDLLELQAGGSVLSDASLKVRITESRGKGSVENKPPESRAQFFSWYIHLSV